ncbi:orotidine-5'-phosphate decarboxylase [Atopobium deltae]|uniref:Orotidine 5'-phosphate decarboxylase n=1 Tax=Atopobium deltae TaxID=1393034 RepID=A0A133XSD2_9ACTN|nr:orotidine-5'-phosphate decarboxylase [Atopobium deltae]KXB33845.1 orotidine 5'-phosphate decarboxylase [Atopobium deltae]
MLEATNNTFYDAAYDACAQKIIVALDCDEDTALELVKRLSGHAQWVKVGMTLYYACGPRIISTMHEAGMKVFLDLKLHDIPHQVHGAIMSAARAGADIISIHGLGGPDMIAAAAQGLSEHCFNARTANTKLIAITVLTSMNQQMLEQIGISDELTDEVKRLAELAYTHGAHGVVCSPQEASMMRELLGEKALIVTPGVRPRGSQLGDQKRTATPAQALAAGASMVVIGRPITQADDPVAAFDGIIDSIIAES